MNVLCLMRGQMEYVKRFITDLNSQFLPFEKYNKETGQLEKMFLQVRISPVQLYDISFPEEHKDVVLTTLFKGRKGEPDSKGLKKLVWGLRKALHLQPIPDYKSDKCLVIRPLEHTEMVAIGCKPDYWITENDDHVSKEEKTDKSYEGI